MYSRTFPLEHIQTLTDPQTVCLTLKNGENITVNTLALGSDVYIPTLWSYN